MKKALLFILTLQIFISLNTKAQCSFTTSIVNNGSNTGCGPRLLSATNAGNTWTQKASSGFGSGYYQTGFTIGNKGYLGTGIDNSFVNSVALWEYDPATNTWTQKANFGGVGRYSATGFSIGAKGYIGFGYDGTQRYADFWEYDPATNAWTQKTSFPGTARYEVVGFGIGTKGYIGTGQDNFGYTNEFYEFDPSTNAWTQKANFAGLARLAAVGFAIGSKGYIGTGATSANSASNDMWEYDPATNTWTQKAPMPGNARSHASAFVIGNKGYVGFGYDPFSPLSTRNDLYEFNPVTNTWAAMASLTYTLGRRSAVGFGVGNYGYVCNGIDYNSSSALNDFYQFAPPATYSWSTGSSASAITATAAGTYSLLLTDVAGCTATATQTLAISPNPTISISGSSVMCSGASVNLVAGGATTYTWSANAGSANSASVSVSPTVITAYTVSGTTGTCTANAIQIVTPYSALASSLALTGSSVTCGSATLAAVSAGDNWTQKTNFGGAARTYAGGFTINDKAYLGAGLNGSGTNDFWEFNAATNAWTQKANIGGAGRYAAAYFSIGGKGYCGLGFNSIDLWEYDPGTDSWTQKADLNAAPRSNMASWSNGSNGFIVGGIRVGSLGKLSETWAYDPVTNTWSQKANYPGGVRSDMTAFVINNLAYVGLGSGSNTIYQSTFYEYNAATDTWTQKAALPAPARAFAAGFSIGNKGFICGGSNGTTMSDVWEYNQGSNSWTQRASYGGGARFRAVGFSIGSRGYVATGSNGSTSTNDLYEYNLSGTYAWSNAATTQSIAPTTSGNYSVVVSNFGGCSATASQSLSISPNPTLTVSGNSLSCNGAAVALSVSGASTYTWSANAGGSNASNISVSPTVNTTYTVSGTTGTCVTSALHQQYVASQLLSGLAASPSSVICGSQVTLTANTPINVWTQKTNFGGLARSGAVAFSIGLKGYVGLGGSGSTSNVMQNDFWEYDPSTNAWTQKANFFGAARTNASAFTISSKGYVGIGKDISNNVFNDWYEYDPTANTWTQKAVIATGRYSAGAFSIGSKGYIACGYSTTYLNDCWEFDPTANTWTQKANFGGAARSGAAAFSIGNKGYLGTGNTGTISTTDFWEFDPIANTWTQKANIGGAQRANTTGFSIGNYGYITTGNTSTDVWQYTQSSNTWSAVASIPANSRYDAVGFSIGLKGYIGLGREGSSSSQKNDVWEYEAGSNLWSTGTSTSNIITPTVSGTYSLTSTSILGCSATSAQVIGITPNPTISIAGANTLCGVSSTTLTGSGATTYTWSSNAGGSNNASVAVSPSVIATYTLSGTSNTCSSNNTITVQAYPSSTVAVVPLTSTVMCGAVTLSASASGNTLTAKATFGGTARYGAVAFNIGSKGYFGTGFDGANKNDFWEYDISTNVWTQKANFGGVARRHAVGFAIGTKGYIGTGYTTGAVADFWEYNPATNTWASKTSYPINVWGAVGFGIGSKGYIQGGSNTSGSTINNNLREYDPTTNTWLSRNNAPATSYLASAFVVNSTVYVCGGQNTSGYLNTVYAWNQTAGSWTTKTPFPGTARRSASGFAIGTKGFVAGGYDGNAKNEIYEYNTISNTWTQRASLATARYYSAAFSDYNRGYVIGGYSGSANLGDMWQYDALPTYSWSSGATTETVSLSTTGTYTVTGTYAGGCSNFSTQNIAVSPFPTIAISGPTAGICGASITLSGSGASTYTWSSNAGSLNTSSVSVSPTVNTTYSLSGTTGSCSSSSSLAVIGKKVVSSAIVSSIPTTTCGSITLSVSPVQGNTFTAKTSLPGTIRSGAVAFSIGSKGYVGTGNPITALNDFWEYDVAADTWTQKANYPVAVVYAVGFSIGSYGYLGSGMDDFNAYRSNFYRYDPATNTWSAMASVGGSGARAYATAFATSTKGYICGGYNGSSALNDLIEYDPGTNTWTSKTGITGARAEAVGFSMNNKGYVGCGSDLTNNLSDFWEYNPTTDTWAQKTNYPGAGWMLNYAVSVNNRGFVGGGIGAFGFKQSDFWEYSASTNSWTSVSPMPYTRNGGSAFAANNRAYFFGGENNVADFNDLYEFEPPAQGAWSTGSVSAVLTTSTTGTYSVLVTNADGCTASYSQTVALSPGVPLVVTSPSVICEGQTATLTASGANTYTWGATAGNSTSSLVTLSPTVATNYSVIAQTGSCIAISSVAVAVNTLPIINISAPGGTAACGSSSVTLNASSTYVWVQRASCGNASGRMYAVAFSIGTKGYMGTGYGTSGFNNDFWEYDPATNTWTQKANFAGGARQQAVGFSIGTKGYVGTGVDGSSTLTDFWEYDPSNNTWTQKTNFGGGARYAAVGFGIGTKGYIGTGVGAGLLNDLWEYDPGNNSWTQKTNLGGLGRYGACAFSIGSKAYVSSGYLSNSTLGNDIWEYDQGGNSWTQKASYTFAGRFDAASASANNRGYIIGGDDGSTYLSQVLEYNPVSNTWAQVSSLAATTSGPSAFGIGSKLFVNGGNAGLYGGFNDHLFEYTGSNYPFVWSTTSTLTAISVTNSGSYSVTTTNTVTGCSNTAVQSVSIVPGISVSVSGPSVICSGSANLTASGASNYTWSANAGSSTLSTVAVSPSTTTTYSVLGALGTCTSLAVYSLAIAAPVTVSAVASSTLVCNGGTVVLNGTGASTYTWSGGVSNNVAFTPTAGGSYSVTGTSSAGCTASAQVSVGIAATPTITVSNGTICSGSSFNISPSGASTYTFSGGSAVVSPTVTTTYSITGSSAQGCAASNTAVATVSVAACSGASALSFDGTNDHVVTPNLSSSIPANSNITIEAWFKPNAAGVVVGELGNGSLSSLWYLSMIEVVGSGSVMVRVYNLPAVFVGTVSYGTWNHVALRYNHSGTRVDGFLNGVASSSFVTGTRTSPLSASFNQFYQVGGSSLNNLGSGAHFNGSIDEVRIWNTVRSQCDIKTYMNAEIPTGSAGLVANYHFNQGLASQSNSTVTTLTDASGNSNTGSLFNFALTGSVSNWISPGGVVSGFTTTPAPPTLTVNSGAICSGSSFTIIPVGASTYTYSSGSAVVSPTTTTSYSVTGTATNGCLSNTAVVSVTVNSIPNLTVSSGVVCAGSSYTINPLGASSYTYSGGSSVVSPTSTSNYTVIGGNGGCTSSTVVSVGVNPIPTVAITSNTSTICAGKSATLNGSGQTNLVAYYRFDEGSGTTTSDLSGNNLNGTLIGTSTWSASTAPLTGAGNHLNFSSNYVNVPDNAVFNTLQNAITIEAWIYQTDNANNSIVDRANYNFLFSVGPNGQSGLGFFNNNTWNYSSGTVPINQWVHVAVTFNSATSEVKFYMNGTLLSTHTRSGALFSNAGSLNIGRQEPNSCQCNIFNGRIDELRIWRGVRTASQLLASSVSTITPRTFVWSPAASLSSSAAITVTASPVASTIYTLTLTDANGCSANAVSNLSVNSSPVLAVSDGTICSGQSFTLTPSGASSYTYSGGSNVVSPTTNSVYTVTGTNSLGCVGTPVNASVTVNALPVISVNSGSVCSGESFTMIPSGASTYTFSGGSAVVSPTISTSFSVTGTSLDGCVSANSAISAVSVNSVPVISAASTSICAGATATLTANGANTYTWNTSSNFSSITVSPTINTTYTVNGTSAEGCIGNAITTSVTVGAGPAITVNSSTICSGQSTTLTASGVTTFTWSSGANSNSIVVSPSTNTVYTVNGNLSGCPVTANNTSSVIVNASPTITVNSGSICYGENFTLTATGANTYTYSGGTVVSPTLTSSYSVTGTSSLGCASTNTAVSSVVVNTVPVITAASASICSGATTTLTASGANTYTWSNSSNNPSIAVSPTATTIYTVSGTSAAGCNGVAVTTTVTVGAGPAITVNSSTVCSGTSATLTANGVTTFTWSSGANTNSIVVTPATNTVYSVSGNLSGCAVTASNTSSVSVNPTPTISASSGSICNGNSFTISPSGGSSYTISGGSAIVSPSVTTSYTIDGTNSVACSSSTIISVTVAANPTLSFGSTTAVCSGQSATLSVSGASTYTWNTSATTNSIVVSPSVNTNYSVIGTSTSGCSASTVQLLTVNDSPTLSISGTSSICVGQIANLDASGAITYSWSTGATTSSISVTPTNNLTYTVSGTNSLGCSSTLTSSVAVIQNPTISISGPSSICLNQTLSLTASGASSYSWNTGATSSLIVTTPTANTSYTVTGSSAQACSNTSVVTITVNANPTVNIAGNFTICNGQTATLTANGAASYTWNTSATTNTLSVSPSSNTGYTVTGTNTLGCSSFTTQLLTVNAVPSLSVIGTSSLCEGQTLSLTASGASTYTWDTGANTVSISATPTSNVTYTVTGTNSLLCSSTLTHSVMVNPNPTVTISGSSGICSGQSATLIANGATTYSWSNSATGSLVITNPTANTTYTVTGIDLLGCSSSTTQLVTVSATLNVSIAGPTSVCAGQSVNLSGNGATTYTWNTGATSSTITESPISTTTYSVIGASGTCSNTALLTVSVNPNPTITVSGSSVVCDGQSTTLNASGADTYTWLVIGVNTSSVVLTPTVATVYTVSGSDNSGCGSITTVSIGVNALPAISASPVQQTICLGEVAGINPLGGTSYTLSNGDSGTSTFTVSPTTFTQYTLTGVDLNLCSNTAKLHVEVSPCTGLANNGGIQYNLGIYPNPTIGKIAATFEFEGVKYISIYNEIGQCVERLTTENYTEEIDLSGYAKGIYFIRIRSTHASANFRVVVQ